MSTTITPTREAQEITTAQMAAARQNLGMIVPATSEVWLAVRTDDLDGDGTRENPYDASTAAKHDAILRSLPAGPLVINYGEGTFLTRGVPGAYIYLRDADRAMWYHQKHDWTIRGQPGYRTTIKLEDDCLLTDAEMGALTGASYGTFAANAATNVCTLSVTLAAAGLRDNNIVQVATSAADQPAGLTTTDIYYLRDCSGSNFKLALTPGGAAEDITDAGTGTHTLKGVTFAQSTILVFGSIYSGDNFGTNGDNGTMSGSFVMEDILLDGNYAGQHADSYIGGAGVTCRDITYRRVKFINGSTHTSENFFINARIVDGTGHVLFDDCEVSDCVSTGGGGFSGCVASTEGHADTWMSGGAINCRFDGGGFDNTFGFGMANMGGFLINCEVTNADSFQAIDTGQFKNLLIMGCFGRVSDIGFSTGLGGTGYVDGIQILNNRFLLRSGSTGFWLGEQTSGRISGNRIEFDPEASVGEFTANVGTEVCTLIAHGIATATPVKVTSTGNPYGLTPLATYYLRAVSADTFTLHDTGPHATANTNVVNLTTGAGTQTLWPASLTAVAVRTFAGTIANAWQVDGNQFDSRMTVTLAATIKGSGNTTLAGAAFPGLPEVFATAAAVAVSEAALAATIPLPAQNYGEGFVEHIYWTAEDGYRAGDIVRDPGSAARWRVLDASLLSPDAITPASAGAWELVYGASTVATLPSAVLAGAGARYAATDANASQTAGHGTTVAAGGANFVSLTSNGTAWKIQ